MSTPRKPSGWQPQAAELDTFTEELATSGNIRRAGLAIGVTNRQAYRVFAQVCARLGAQAV